MDEKVVINGKEVRFVDVYVEPLFIESAEINGIKETEENLNMPFVTEGGELRKHNWKFTIDVETGKILGWPQGTDACVFYKVCDQGIYEYKDVVGNLLYKEEWDYVPRFLQINEEGWNDYIFIDIDENGYIENWKFNSKLMNKEISIF